MKRRQILGLAAAAAMSLHAQSGGQAEVALQGFYQGGGTQPLLDTTGVAFKFQELFPQIGLIRADLEGYRTGGSIQPADNFLELRGLVVGGLRWNLTGGDFRVPSSPLQKPFFNLFFPEINARGAQIEAGNSRSTYTVFYGSETLLAGPRIPFRVNVPQTAMGASMRQKFGRLETGVRLLHLASSERDLEGNPLLFPAGRRFLSADNLTVYTAYVFSDNFRWYGEATGARAREFDGSSAGQPISYFFGPSWESPRVTVRANYADFGRSYFPVAGYSIGDRRGPYGEVRLRPVPRLVLFGSASRYETTEKHDPVIPYISSTAASAGANLELPWRFSASAQLSTIQFYSFDSKSAAEQNSRNRQWTGTLNRQIGHQTLRFAASDTRLMISGLPSRERSGEAEDMFHFRHVVLGGAGRLQQSMANEHRNSVFLRGSAQIDLGRLTAYGYFEGGKDLANQTVFATNTTSSSVVTATLRLTRKWSIQGEAYRSRSIASLNPESLFVQGNSGVIVDPVLNRFNQWSFLFKIVRSFNWGSALPAGSLDQYMRQRIPLIGSVEGHVYVLAAGGTRPAPGVVVTLESGLRAATDVNGQFRFENVPEGLHTVSLNLEELPAEYDPGAKTNSAVSVSPRRVSRADLELYAFSSFFGRVAVSSGSAFDSLEGIVIRLNPGDRYTTTLKDGSFTFYNLPDGFYEASIAENTLPQEASLKSPPNAAVTVRAGEVPAAVQFDIERRPVEGKPVRKILEQRIESPLRLSGENRGEISGLNEAPRVKAEFGEPVSRTSKGPPAPTVLPGVPADAKSAAACNTRGRELLDQGKYREAIEELSEALRQKPDFALALNARGFAYYRLRDYKHALADFDEAIRLNPNYLNAYQNRSKARKAFAKSVLSKPADTIPEGLVKPKEPEVPARAPAPVVSALVEPASRTRQPAAPAASPAVPADAKSAADCNARGRELLNQGKYREAIEELSEAVRQKPDFALALNARGFAYYRLRDYKHALADFDEAIRLNPKYLNAYQNRSKARKASGDDEGSLSDERKLRESR